MARRSGRPPKLIPERIDVLLENLGLGMHPEDACAQAQLGYSTFRGWIQRGTEDQLAGRRTRYSDFLLRFNEAASRAIRRGFMTISGAALGFPDESGKRTGRRDWRAARALVELANPGRYARVRHELGGPDGGPITLASLDAVLARARELRANGAGELPAGDTAAQGSPAGLLEAGRPPGAP